MVDSGYAADWGYPGSPGSTSEPRSTTINGATPPPGRDVRGIRDSRGAREGRVTPSAWPTLRGWPAAWPALCGYADGLVGALTVGGLLGRSSGALVVDFAVPPGGGAQLADPRRPGQHDEEHAADRGEQQGHAERKVTMHAQVGDADVGVVLQDEDQQEEQDDGEETHRHPDPAGPGALDAVLRQWMGGRRGRRGRFRGRRCLLGRDLRRVFQRGLGRGGFALGRGGLRICGHLLLPRV